MNKPKSRLQSGAPRAKNAVRRKPFVRLLCCSLSALLASCAGQQSSNTPADIAQPQARPVHNLTSFDESLRCMDGLFLDHGVKDVVITSQGIPDATGEIRTGSKEMLISAISRMSTYSGAFRFVDYDQRQFDINELQKLVGFTKDFLVPNYYIRGAITQFDEQVVSDSQSGGLSLDVFDVGASQNKVTSLVSIDLNVGNLLTRQILTGTSATNTIAVSRTGKSADSSGSINKLSLGFSFNVNMGRSEGMHQSVRTLLQLSAIESLGKLTEVPYWQCLGLGQTSTAMMEQAQGWYARMSHLEQREFVQRALSGLGLYNGPIDGRPSVSLRESVGRYQAGKNLLADGNINFQLYASLISEDLALGQAPQQKNGFINATQALAKKGLKSASEPKSSNQGFKKDSAPLGLSLKTLENIGSYSKGDTLSITLHITDDAFAYCYYQDDQNTVVRLFPNRFQPNALIGAKVPLRIPGEKARFEIALEQSGVEEEVLCLASQQELGIYLPKSLKGQDLSPLSVPSLNAVAEIFDSLGGNQVVSQRLLIPVSL